MKTPKKNQRGALGNIVASHNRFGDYDRDRVSPTQQFTPATEHSYLDFVPEGEGVGDY